MTIVKPPCCVPLTVTQDRLPGWAGRHAAVHLMAACIVAAGPATGCRRHGEPARPEPVGNVLLITFDTTRADRLGCYGYGGGRTPNVDRLASEGWRYTRCYAPAPLTLPSHASLLTGLYPFRHGLIDNGIGPLDERVVTLAEKLQGRGYTTGAVIGAFVLSHVFGISQGFESYMDEVGQPPEGTRFREGERDARAVTGDALAWLDAHGRNPWFLWVHYFDPHAPYEPPESTDGMDSSKAYDLEIAYADRQMGRLLDRVEQLDRDAHGQTLIVFTADHGEALGDHGEPTHGLFVYNDCLRVPLIVRVPGRRRPGSTIDHPVSLVDVFPSALRFAGLDPPYPVDGRLLPEPGTDPDGEHRPILFENVRPHRGYGWSALTGIILDQTKLIVAPRLELYDLEHDPHELTNLAPDQPELASRLREAVDDLRSALSGTPEFTGVAANLDEKQIHKLESLGYVGAGDTSEMYDGTLPNPMDLVDVHAMFVKAAFAIDDGRPGDALVLARRILKRDPDNRRCLQMLMDLLNRKPNRLDAISILTQRLESPLRPPFDHQVPLRLAIAVGKEGQIAESQRLLTDVLRIAPKNAEAHFFMGQALLRLAGPRSQIESHLGQAFSLDPANPLYAIELARWHRGNDAFDKMAAVLRRMVGVHPNHAYAHYGLGLALGETGDWEGSRRELRRAIELAGGTDPAWIKDARKRVEKPPATKREPG